MSKYKTFEELKEELGDKFEEYMYKSNIELLTKIDKAIEYIKKHSNCSGYFEDGKMIIDNIESIYGGYELLEILGDKELDEESKDEKYETYTLIEDEENGTKLINGEWYRVEKK